MQSADASVPQITMRRFGRRLKVEELRGELADQGFFLRTACDSMRTASRTVRHCDASRRLARRAAALQIPRLITSSEPTARAFYEAALAAGHEGLMAKALEWPLRSRNRARAGSRSSVRTPSICGCWLPSGARPSHRQASNLHLGALEPATGEYVMLGKTFKGLTDAMLEWQTKELLARESHRDQWTVYVRPELVVEIAFSDLQASSRYPGGPGVAARTCETLPGRQAAEDADTMESVRRVYAGSVGRVTALLAG